MTRWFVFVLVACSSGSGGGGCGKDPVTGGPDLLFTDANNFEYKALVDIESVEVEAVAEFCADWSGMTKDLRERGLVPSDVEQVAFLEFDLTQEEVAAKVAANTLVQADAATQWLFDNTDGATSACASEFNIIGNYLDPTDPDILDDNPSQSWLMSLLKLPDGVNDVLTSVFVEPTTGSASHEVAFNDASTVLDVTTLEIASKDPIKTTADIGPYTLDWSEVTVDVNGQAYEPLSGDKLLIGRYDVADAEGIEPLFLTLDSSAAEIFKMDVFGETSADLTEAESSDGTAFPGFTTEGVWVVAISCSTCTSPVPLLLAYLDVGAGE